MEDGDRPTKKRASKGLLFFAYCDRNSPHFSSVSCTYFRHTTAHPRDVTTEIIDHWSPDRTTLPLVHALSEFLDAPLHERAKIPLFQYRFDSLISHFLKDWIGKEDLEKLADQEDAEEIYRWVSSVLDDKPPCDGENLHSYIPFWDSNIRKIIQVLVPGRFIRDGCCHSSAANQKPSFGFLYHGIRAFRGEETANYLDDPRAELSGKMTWKYEPAPYVLGKFFCIRPILP